MIISIIKLNLDTNAICMVVIKCQMLNEMKQNVNLRKGKREKTRNILNKHSGTVTTTTTNQPTPQSMNEFRTSPHYIMNER